MTDADKKTSVKGISNFEKCVNLYSRRNYHLVGKYHPAICAVQLHLVHTESYLSTKQGGTFLYLHYFGTVNTKL